MAQPTGDRYTARTTANDSSEFVIQTLCGDFVEKGVNHGKKFFQKMAAAPGQPTPEVFLYYWDNRDGPSYEGWWFGKAVGGNEVWSHNVAATDKPPTKGWKIPFAGAVRNTFEVSEDTSWKQAQQLASGTEQALAEAQAALLEARTSCGDYADAAKLEAAEEALTPHCKRLADIGEGLQKMSLVNPTSRQQLARVRTTEASLKQEGNKIRLALPKARAEQEEAGKLQEMLVEVQSKVEAAEDAAEKTAITYQLVEQAGDSPEEAERAIQATEEAAREAQMAVKEANSHVSSRILMCRAFKGIKTRTQAETELNALRARLQETNKRVQPMANVKQAVRQQKAAGELMAKVEALLARTDGMVDQAHAACTPLHGVQDPPSDAVRAADQALTMAERQVAGTQRMIEQTRLQGHQNPFLRLEDAVERTSSAHKRLESLKVVFKETKEKEASASMIVAAAEKMRAVLDLVASAASLLDPLLSGESLKPLDQTLEDIRMGEAQMAGAAKAATAARTTIALNILEVKRCLTVPGRQAYQQLQDHQRELESALEKIEQLKAGTSRCKVVALKLEVSTRVEEAEALVEKAEAAMALVGDESTIKGLSEAELRERGAQAVDFRTACEKACKLATDLVRKRQIQAKSKSPADVEEVAELSKYQARASAAQTESDRITKMKVPAAVEAQIAIKKLLNEVISKVAVAEERAHKVMVNVQAVVESIDEGEEVAADAASSKPRGDKHSEMVQEVALAQTTLKGAASFVSMQQKDKSKKLPKEELTKLQERVKEAQRSLEHAEVALKGSSERAAARRTLSEVQGRVKESETAVQKALNIAGFLPTEEDDEDAPVDDETVAAVADFNEAVQVANKALSSAKTLLAVKKVAAKRFSQAVSSKCLEEMAAMQGRMEDSARKLTEIRAKAAGRKFAKAKREAQAKIEEVQQQAESHKAACEVLQEGDAAKSMSATELKESLEKAAALQSPLQAAIRGVREQVDSQVREAKAGSDGGMVDIEFKDLFSQLEELQSQFDARSKQINKMEENFATKCLLSEVSEMFEALDAKLEQARAATAPLVGDRKEDFAASVSLDVVVEVLRAYAHKSSLEPAALFQDMGGDDDGLSEEKFVTFMKGLADLRARPGAPTSPAQLKACFQRLREAVAAGAEVKANSLVSQSAFDDLLVTRYLCPSGAALTKGVGEGCPLVRELAANEVVEAISAPEKDDAGATWLEVKATPDGMPVQGYVVLSAADGISRLEKYTPYVAVQKRIELAIEQAGETLNKTQAFLKQKSEEIKASKVGGPLTAVKAEMMKMRVRASKAQSQITTMKNKVAAATKDIEAALQEEKKRVAEAEAEAEAAATTADANTSMESITAQVEKSAVAAELLVKAKGADSDSPLEAMEKAERALEAALASVVAVDKKFSATMGEIRLSTKVPLVELRRLLYKFKAKLPLFQTRCKKQMDALRNARKNLAADAQVGITAALRNVIRKESTSASELFRKLSPSGDAVRVEKLRSFLEGLPDSGLRPAQLDLGLCGFSPGVGLLGFVQLLSEYRRCVRDIALTEAFQVKGTIASKGNTTVRKLAAGECVEVLEGEQRDETSGLMRVKCRALRDLAEGYCTLRSNQNTEFLALTKKPFKLCEAETALEEECESGSAGVRTLLPGEVVELLQGPYQEPPREATRVKGVAARDGEFGWVTVKEGAQASASMELAKKLVCKGSIAITDSFDIGKSKAIRKLEVGETLEALEEPQEDSVRKLRRIKLKALSDGKEGWATMKGNQGTIYVEESTSHYSCVRPTPLESDVASGSSVVRMLDPGELFDVCEETKEVLEGSMRARGRVVPSEGGDGGGATGWFTVDERVVDWCTSHRCKESTELFSDVGEVVRVLEKGEVLELTHFPAKDGATGALRASARAEKDGAVGVAVLRDADGKVLLEPVS